MIKRCQNCLGLEALFYFPLELEARILDFEYLKPAYHLPSVGHLRIMS